MSRSAEHWVATEFDTVNFGDLRLRNRFMTIAKQLASRFGNNISSSFAQWKDIKATYRFLSNNKVSQTAILTPHIRETVERIKSHQRVFLAQDTTYLDFSKEVSINKLNNLRIRALLNCYGKYSNQRMAKSF